MGLANKIRTALGLEGNILPILSIRSLDATGWQMFEAIWQPYLLSLGTSMQQVGIISSIYLAFFAGFQFFTGNVSDSLGRKHTINIAYVLSLVSILFTFVTGSWVLLIPVMVLFALVDALADPAMRARYAMIIKSYGLSALTIAFAANVFTMTTALSLFATGRIVDMMGSRKPIIASNISWILALGAYFFSYNLNILFLAQFIRGISVALWDPALNTYVASQTLESDRGRVIGKVGALKGILTFPAPLLGATLFNKYGFSGPIAFSVLGILISTFLAIGLDKK